MDFIAMPEELLKHFEEGGDFYESFMEVAKVLRSIGENALSIAADAAGTDSIVYKDLNTKYIDMMNDMDKNTQDIVATLESIVSKDRLFAKSQGGN